jgi:hypothetical protein
MQGEKDAGQCWYDLLAGSLLNIGIHCSVADHAVFTWKERSSYIYILPSQWMIVFVSATKGNTYCASRDAWKRFLSSPCNKTTIFNSSTYGSSRVLKASVYITLITL